MTYEKAKYNIARYVYVGGEENKLETEALEIAVEALETRIPKKTKIETSPGGFIESYYCPVCGRYFGDKARNCAILFHTPKYCECGQALKWGDE